ncbi:MAG: ClpP family protease, partial [Micrococcales bacterium]
GTAADVQTQAELIMSMKRQLASLTAGQTGKTVEQIMQDGDRDRWFTAQEALEYGFIDHIQQFAGSATGVGNN